MLSYRFLYILNSFLFVLFVVISLFIYYVIPKKLQWIWLLVISYVYYITNSRGLVVFIAATTLTTWYAGLTLEKTEAHKKRRLIVALTLLFNFGILAVLKYTNFLIVNINDLFHTSILQFSWALPLGISFYTFQSMGYLLDICWKRTAAEKNLFRFALFVSFFPQILQGPIGRYSRLAHQLYEEHSFDPGRFERGFQRILWGFFKKMVIADNALYFVNPLFKEYQTYDGVALFATVFYAIQLYMDFSGGIDVVIGIADLFGVTMDENFRQPYFAVSITDFWHRWHITLGTWVEMDGPLRQVVEKDLRQADRPRSPDLCRERHRLPDRRYLARSCMEVHCLRSLQRIYYRSERSSCTAVP